MAWTIPAAAAVVTGLHTESVGSVVCTTQAPCRPDPVGSVAVGLLALAAVAGFIFPRLSAWFGAGFVVALVISERLLRADLVSPAWLYIVDLGFAGLCVLLARISRDRQPTDQALHWLAAARRERPSAAADLPRLGQTWRLFGWALLVPAVACLVWGWYSQQQADAQQRAATRATAEVTAHADEFTVEVRLAGETTAISVLDARNYPVGEQVELYVDGNGMRQPVSEPYDASGWTFLAVLLAGLAVAFWARGVEKGYGLRQLFEEEQPVSEVSVLAGAGIIAVYAGDARPGEPAIAEIRTRRFQVREDGDGQFRVIGLDLEPGPQPASLYGIPAPGHWCAVVVNGQPVVPTRPLSAKSIAAPPYGSYAAGNPANDEASDASADPPWTASAPALPRAADLPLRPEQVETLRAVDRLAKPDQVRFHRRTPVVGYISAATMPLALIIPGRLLSDAPYSVTLLIAGAVLAGSCAIAWRFLMRSRIAWNGWGIAVVGAIGAKRVGWRMVSEIEHDRDSVTIHTGYRALVVSAGPTLGIFGRRDRSAEELANALRHAKNALPVGGHEAAVLEKAVVDARLLDASTDALPHLDAPRAPIGLWVLWLLGTPALAWGLQVLSAI